MNAKQRYRERLKLRAALARVMELLTANSQDKRISPDQTTARMASTGCIPPAALRVPGLDPRRRYRVSEVTLDARLPRRAGLPDSSVCGLGATGAAGAGC